MSPSIKYKIKIKDNNYLRLSAALNSTIIGVNASLPFAFALYRAGRVPIHRPTSA
jgi:hypothetical protein